jgi:hypothetical protein
VLIHDGKIIALKASAAIILSAVLLIRSGEKPAPSENQGEKPFAVMFRNWSRSENTACQREEERLCFPVQAHRAAGKKAAGRENEAEERGFRNRREISRKYIRPAVLWRLSAKHGRAAYLTVGAVR